MLGKIGKRENDPLFTLNLDDHEAIKSLGLCWKPVTINFYLMLLPCQISTRFSTKQGFSHQTVSAMKYSLRNPDP